MDWTRLDKTWERLRWARINAGFQRPTDAARSLDIKPVTYRTYEHGPDEGGREAPLSELQRMARKFQIDWIWLASGRGSPFLNPEDDPRIQKILKKVLSLPRERRDDALDAADAVIDSIARRTR